MVEKKKKEADIGMKKAGLICDMRPDRRLEFIAEGLPILFASAKSLIMASQTLKQFPREAEILEGHCEEECAKILILLDITRCPRITADQLRRMMGWFYCHLTHLLYAQAQRWRLVNAVELQEFIDRKRKSHHLYGEDGYEDILPNWALFERESSLYADVVLAESGDAVWHSPVEMFEGAWRPDDYYLPTSFRVVEALEAFGVFTSEGLKVFGRGLGEARCRGQVLDQPAPSLS